MNDLGNAILLVTGLIGYGIYRYPKWKSHSISEIVDDVSLPSIINNNNITDNNNTTENINNISIQKDQEHSSSTPSFLNFTFKSKDKSKEIEEQLQQQEETKQKQKQQHQTNTINMVSSTPNLFDKNNQIKRRIFD